MSTKKERKGFEPRLVGCADFASNGNVPGPSDMHFKITQVTINGACIIEQLQADGSWLKLNHASSVEKAWDSVRYQAGITHYTERSLGAPETDPIVRPIVFKKKVHVEDGVTS